MAGRGYEYLSSGEHLELEIGGRWSSSMSFATVSARGTHDWIIERRPAKNLKTRPSESIGNRFRFFKN